MQIFTLITYKPNGVDTCRGCVMDSWDSNYKIANFPDVDKLAAAIAKYEFENAHNGREPDWEIDILLNGYPLNWGKVNEDACRSKKYDAMYDQYAGILDHIEAKKVTILEELDLELKRENLRKAQEAADKKEQDRKAQEQRDWAKYQELKSKFEGTVNG